MIHMLNCVFLDIIKNINVKVFNLLSRINETRHIMWHKTCNCICRLSASVCNNRQRWNENKCRCECKRIWDKGYTWNPSSCQCECDKSCGIGEYSDYKKCVRRKSIVDKLIEECTYFIDSNDIYSETLDKISLDDCASCTVYVVLFPVFLRTSVMTGCSFIYFYWHRKKTIRFKKYFPDAKYSKTETLIH